MRFTYVKLCAPVLLLAGMVAGCGDNHPAPTRFTDPEALATAVGCGLASVNPDPELGAESGFDCGDESAHPGMDGVWFRSPGDIAAWEQTGEAMARAMNVDDPWPRLVGDRWVLEDTDEATLRAMQDRFGGDLRT